jgi:hypothetical protein
MFQFLVIPVLLALPTVIFFKAKNPLLGFGFGISLFAYCLNQPLGGFVLWMGGFLLLMLCIRVLIAMISTLFSIFL